MDPQKIKDTFLALWDDVVADKPQPSTLAHYTSVTVLESIVTSGELWFSNPLNMNDYSELQYFLHIAREHFWNFRLRILDACNNDHDRYQEVFNSFEKENSLYLIKEAFDTYVFCLSVQNADDDDGRLSMWRGYGGNGHGVALVFSTENLMSDDKEKLVPLTFAPIEYLSGSDRIDWLNRTLNKYCDLLKENKDIPLDLLHHTTSLLFERILLFALYTKHPGFKEEQEWRLSYLPSRDPEMSFGFMFNYAISDSGIEHKLKFKMDSKSNRQFLENLIYKIIIGPSNFDTLTEASVKRMLQVKGYPSLAERVISSSIPYRKR